MRTTAGHTTGSGFAPPAVRMSHGTYTPTVPGMITVNSRFRSARLTWATLPWPADG